MQDRNEGIIVVIAIIMAWLIQIGARPLRRTIDELIERRRFARDLDRWIAEMGLE